MIAPESAKIGSDEQKTFQRDLLGYTADTQRRALDRRIPKKVLFRREEMVGETGFE